MEKICTKCKQSKDLSNFSKKTGDKYHSQCRDCKSSYYKYWYERNGRKRKVNYEEIICLWQELHSIEVSISAKVRYLIKKGLIIRPSECSICGRTARINGHHEDYSKPFNILWICSSCHKKLHLGFLTLPLDKER